MTTTHVLLIAVFSAVALAMAALAAEPSAPTRLVTYDAPPGEKA